MPFLRTLYLECAHNPPACFFWATITVACKPTDTRFYREPGTWYCSASRNAAVKSGLCATHPREITLFFLLVLST